MKKFKISIVLTMIAFLLFTVGCDLLEEEEKTSGGDSQSLSMDDYVGRWEESGGAYVELLEDGTGTQTGYDDDGDEIDMDVTWEFGDIEYSEWSEDGELIDYTEEGIIVTDPDDYYTEFLIKVTDDDETTLYDETNSDTYYLEDTTDADDTEDGVTGITVEDSSSSMGDYSIISWDKYEGAVGGYYIYINDVQDSDIPSTNIAYNQVDQLSDGDVVKIEALDNDYEAIASGTYTVGDDSSDDSDTITIDPVTSVTTSDITATSVTLNWKNPDSTMSKVIIWDEEKTDDNIMNSVAKTDSNSGDEAITIDDLTEGTEYTFYLYVAHYSSDYPGTGWAYSEATTIKVTPEAAEEDSADDPRADITDMWTADNDDKIQFYSSFANYWTAANVTTKTNYTYDASTGKGSFTGGKTGSFTVNSNGLSLIYNGKTFTRPYI